MFPPTESSSTSGAVALGPTEEEDEDKGKLLQEEGVLTSPVPLTVGYEAPRPRVLLGAAAPATVCSSPEAHHQQRSCDGQRGVRGEGWEVWG